MGMEICKAIKTIQEIVQTSDMNLWVACLLTNQGFLIHHPVMTTKIGQQDLRQIFVRDKQEMSTHLGTASFARVLLWSHHTYTLKEVAYFPPDFHFRLDLSGQHGGMSTVKKRKKSAMATMNSGKDIHLPEIKEIQQFLEDSITSLSEDDFDLLQSILVDFYVLHRWTQPFSMKTKKSYVEGYENGDITTPKSASTDSINTSNGHLSDAWNFYKQTLPKKCDATIEDEDMEEDEDDEFFNYGEIDENDDEQYDSSVR